jgi:group I intron endonuclease
MKKCGIYKITNKQTGKFYIGSSIDIRQRWYAHKSKLRRDVHCNQHLQNSWNKYGEESFLFEVVLCVDEESLLTEEQRVMDETGCCDRGIGYNKAIYSSSPMKGKNHSDQTKQKLREIMTGRKVSDQTKKKISKANKGRVFSEETKRKMSEAKLGKAPTCAYDPPSEEGRKKLSEFAKTRTGHKNPNSRLTPEQIQSMRVDFESKEMTNGQIAEKYEVSLSTVKRVKYGKTKY